MNERILVVDDEKELADLVEVYLKNDGYTVYKCYNGMDALKCIETVELHLAILDIMLPDIDGLRICQKIREKFCFPVIMLTAKVEDGDKIMGLSIADDYITKPFSLRELEARIVTNIKREERHQQKTEYRFMDEMLIDYSEKIVAIAGHRMEFTKIEYQIIEFLSMHPGQVFDKERIYAQVCGYDAEGDSRTITELVRRIRKKIADYSEKEYIETVWGIGYRWKK